MFAACTSEETDMSRTEPASSDGSLELGERPNIIVIVVDDLENSVTGYLFLGLRPAFRGAKQRPVIFSSFLTKLSEPRGLPMRP